jgi:choline dehydrogenase-like flavoprotein
MSVCRAISAAGCGRPCPGSRNPDRTGKAHELDNLYVVDTSVFVSIGAVNPSLTAIALRVGDHLLERLG